MKISRNKFISSLLVVPFLTKKEQTIGEYLVSKGFRLNLKFELYVGYSKEITDSKYVYLENTINIYLGENNQVNVHVNHLSSFYGKIKNVEELKQLFKFLQIK